jgi:hypothetical protein
MPYPTSIRLPEDVRKILRRTAKQNRRTVTEQINFVLQEWILASAKQAKDKSEDVVTRVDTVTGSADEQTS